MVLVYLGGDELCSPDEHGIGFTAQKCAWAFRTEIVQHLPILRGTCCLPGYCIQNHQERAFLFVYAIGFSIILSSKSSLFMSNMKNAEHWLFSRPSAAVVSSLSLLTALGRRVVCLGNIILQMFSEVQVTPALRACLDHAWGQF